MENVFLAYEEVIFCCAARDTSNTPYELGWFANKKRSAHGAAGARRAPARWIATRHEQQGTTANIGVHCVDECAATAVTRTIL